MSKLFYNNTSGQAILQDCSEDKNNIDDINVISDNGTKLIIDKDNPKYLFFLV